MIFCGYYEVFMTTKYSFDWNKPEVKEFQTFMITYMHGFHKILLILPALSDYIPGV